MKKVELIDLPKIIDRRGNLTFLEFPNSLPFEIKRVFWTYDVPGGEKRGGHAYQNQHEIIIALSGSFDVIVRDHRNIGETFSMNRSYYGLYLPPLTWRHMENFSTNAISLHLSSATFTQEDYILDFDTYIDVTKHDTA